jgi:hypothetical protein
MMLLGAAGSGLDDGLCDQIKADKSNLEIP